MLIYILTRGVTSSPYCPFPSSKSVVSAFLLPRVISLPRGPAYPAIGRSAFYYTSHSNPSSRTVYKYPTAGSMNLRALALLSLAVAAICSCAKHHCCYLCLTRAVVMSRLIHVLKVWVTFSCAPNIYGKWEILKKRFFFKLKKKLLSQYVMAVLFCC